MGTHGLETRDRLVGARPGRRLSRPIGVSVVHPPAVPAPTSAVGWLLATVVVLAAFLTLTSSPLALGTPARAERPPSPGVNGHAGRNSGVHARNRIPSGTEDGSQTDAASVSTSKDLEGTANFQVGYSYTQQSHLAQGGQPSAVASAKHLLASMHTFQNVSLMGWGTDDPEPFPGVYSWESLDNRVLDMAATVPASRRMITLCTAPGWMKVGGERQEWNMESAVDPSHYADFAQLAAAVADRYDGFHHAADGQLLPKIDFFDVWNELKGFWDTTTNGWNAEAYTTMYNAVYAAIKAVRPDAEVGGPYVPLGAGTMSTTADPSPIQGPFGVVDQRELDVITYWLAHKTGGQFLSVDGGPASTDESGFSSGQYFVAVADWLRTLNSAAYPGANSLPIVWAEFYPGLDSAWGTATGQEAVAIDVSNIIQAGQAGVNYLLVWEMEGNADGSSPSTGEGVWTSTAQSRGGRPTALYIALADLARVFPPGTPLYRSTVHGPVTALAGKNGVLVVSESSSDLVVTVNGTTRVLPPYAVVVTH